ncbi:unnamed protein product [Paramecium primaurelia]|uniref:Sel1 domain protein repeat-containing protein n=2 Tax=Paramecium TaxID=5884 RepID=A0A8S1LRU0_PARPR|nr:unnamed protein product [Paramecium primaurelia]
MFGNQIIEFLIVMIINMTENFRIYKLIDILNVREQKYVILFLKINQNQINCLILRVLSVFSEQLFEQKIKLLFQYISYCNFYNLMQQTTDYDEMQHYLKLAQDGDTDAQFKVGLMYEDGKGAQQNIQECIQWYQLAANKHAQAAYNLASIYYLGRVVAPDYKIAYKYFSKAAELQNEQGMFQLGLMHLFGQGVEQDFEKSRSWFERAAKLGSVSAMNNLGNIYRSGIGTHIQIEEAKKYYRMAADKGDLCAMTNLATVLLQCNPTEAFDWYLQAAKGGFENAQYNLAVLYEEGTGTKLNLQQALYWYKQAAQAGNIEAKEAVTRLSPIVQNQQQNDKQQQGQNTQQSSAKKGGCGCIVF